MKQSYLEGLSVVTPMVRTMGTCLISLCWLSMALVALYSPIAASQENTTTFPNLLECEDDALPLLIQQAQLTRTNLLRILGDQRSALQNIESWFNKKLTTPATLELVKAVDQAQHELEAFEYLCSAATEVEGSRDTSPSSQTLIAFVEQYKKKFSVTDTEAYCRDAKAHRASHQKDVETSTAMILKLRENKIHADPVLQIQRQGLQRSWAHHKHGLQLVLLDNPQERMKVIRILQRRFQSLPKAPSEASSSPEWMAAVRRVCGPHHQPCPSEVLEELRQIRNLEWQSYRSRAVWMLSRMTYKDLTDLKQHFITDRPEGVAKAGREEDDDDDDDDESRNFITRQKNFYDCINGKQGLDEVDGKMPTNSFHGNRIKLTSSIDIFDDPDPLFAENDSVMRSRIVERRVLQEDLEHALANHADPTGSKIPQDRKWETHHQLRQHRLEMELRHRRCALGLFREILDSSNLVRRYTDTISVVVHEEEMISQLALLPSQSDGPFQVAVFQLFHSVSDLYQQEAMIEEDILADMNIEEWAKQHQAAGAAPHINSDPLLSSWARHALSRFALQSCLKSPSSSSNRTAAATRATPFAADFPLFAVTMLECETLLLSAVAEESLSENMFLEMMNFDGVKAVELSNTRLMIDLLHQLIADYQRTHFELLAQNPHDLNWILSQWMSTTVTNMKQARKDLGLKEAAWSSEVETSVAAVVDSGKAAWPGTVDRAVMWWSLIEQISIRDAGYQLPEGFLLETGFLQWCRVESALRLLQDVVSNEEGSSRPEPSASASSESPPPPPGPRSQSLLWETLNAEQASNFETVLSTITHSDPESIEKSVLELKNHSIFLTDPRAGMTRGFSETKPSPVQRLLAQAWWNVDRYVYDLAFVYRWRFFYLQAAAAGKSDVIDFLERTRYAAMENAHNTAETATPTEATPEEVEDESFDPLYQSMVVACLHVPLRDATIHRKEQAVFNIPSKPTPCPPETTLLFGRLRDMEYQYTRVRALAAALDLEDSELTDLHTSVQGFCPALANPGFAMSGAKSSTEVDSEAPPKPEDLTAPHLKLSALLLLEETAANARQGTLEKVALEKVLDAEVVEQLQAALTGPSGSWERTLAQWFGVSTQEASELLQKYLDLTQDSATLFRAESPEGWLYSNLWGAKAYQSDCTILEGDLRLAIQLSSVATQQQETLAGTNMMQTLDFTIGVTLSEMYRELSLLRAQLGLTTSLMENVPKQRDSIRSPAMQLRNLLIVGHRKRQALCQLSSEPFSSIQSSKTYPQLCDEVGSFCEIGYVKLQSSYDRAVKYTSLVEEQNVPTSPTLAMLVGVVIRRIKGLDTTKRSAMMNHVSESESIARTRVTFRNLGVNVAHWLWNFAARQKKGTSSLFYTVFETIQIGYAWNQLRQQLFSEMSITQVKPQVFIGKYYKRLQHNLRQKSRELFDKDGTNVLQQGFPSSRDRTQGDSAAAEGANEDEDEDEGEDDDEEDEEEDEAIYSISSQDSKAYSRDANRDYKTGNSEGKLEATESHDTTLHKTVSDARRKSRIAVLVLLGCLAAAVVLFALWSLYQRSNSPPSGLRSMHLDEYGYQSNLNETLVAMK